MKIFEFNEMSAEEDFMNTSRMAARLAEWKCACIRHVTACRVFLVIHKVEIITSLVDILVSHPLVVLRRQCQVRADGQAYHLTPISLIPVVVTLVQRNGWSVLFNGILSVVVLRAVQLGTERLISWYTGWPMTLPPTWYVNKDWLLHFLLKFSSVVITAPLYNRSVINSVAVSGDLIDIGFRVFKNYDFPLSFWQTLIPTVSYGILKYAFTQAALSFSAAMLYLNHCFDEIGREACQTVKGGIAFEDRQDIVLKASVMSYLLAEVVFYPLETVVHRLVLQGTHTITNDLDCGSAVVQIFSAHDGFLDCFDNIMWLEGKLGLYKGFGALLMQAVLYHYCIKFVSFAWHYIRIYKKTFSQVNAPADSNELTIAKTSSDF